MKKQQSGFTLIELLTIISLITILSIGVLYSFSKLQKSSQLERSLTDIRNNMTQAREDVRKGKCKSVNFDFKEIDSSGLNKRIEFNCIDSGSTNYRVSIPTDINITLTGTNVDQEISFNLTNNGLGALSYSSTVPLNLNSFTIKLEKSGEIVPLFLDRKTLLYGNF